MSDKDDRWDGMDCRPDGQDSPVRTPDRLRRLLADRTSDAHDASAQEADTVDLARRP